jgi:hypothetical protein
MKMLLYIGADMGLAVSYQPKGTCYQSCPLLASTTIVVRSGVEAVVVDVAVAKALALGVHALADEGFILIAVALHGLLSLVHSTVAGYEIFSQPPFIWPCVLA